MSEETFKNRRGNKVTIREAVADIENNETKKRPITKARNSKKSTSVKPNNPVKAKASTKSVPEAKPSQMAYKPKDGTKPTGRAKKSSSIKKFLKSRTIKVIIVFIAVGGSILILLVGLNADASKRAYDLQAATMQRSVTELTDQPASKDTAGSVASDDLVQQLSAETSCEGSGVDVSSWYGRAHDAKKRCESIADDYKALISTLSTLSNQSMYAESVNKVLRSALRTPDDGAFASVTDYRDRWQETAKDLQKIDAPETMSAANETLLKNTESMRTVWQSLVEASVDQNSDKFTESEKELTVRYAAMRESQTTILQPIQRSQLEINELVSQLTLQE